MRHPLIKKFFWLVALAFGMALILARAAEAIIIYPSSASLAPGDITTAHILNGTIQGGDVNTGSTFNFGRVGISSSTPWGMLSVEATSTTSPGTPIFVVGDQGTSTPMLVVSANGNIGIAARQPAAQLEIGTGQIFAPNGSITAPSYSFSNATNAGMYANISSGGIILNYSGVDTARFTAAPSIDLRSDTNIRWNSDTVIVGTPDLALHRTSANTLEINNGTTGSYSDLNVRAITATSSITLNGALSWTTDNAADIGVSSTSGRPRTIYMATGWNVNNGTLTASAGAINIVAAAGALTFGNGADMSITRTANVGLNVAGGNFGIGTTSPGTILALSASGNAINLTPAATSTLTQGVNIRAGCYAINGACVGAPPAITQYSVPLQSDSTTRTLADTVFRAIPLPDAVATSTWATFWVPSSSAVSAITFIGRTDSGGVGDAVMDFRVSAIGEGAARVDDSVLLSTVSDFSGSAGTQEVTVPAAAYNTLTSGRLWTIEITRQGGNGGDNLGEPVFMEGLLLKY